MPRDAPFKTMEEIAAYVGGDTIECLECGKHFQMITGKHLRLTHGMSQDEYREVWGIPKNVALATDAVRNTRREIIRRLIDDGVITYDHLPTASNPKTRARMSPRAPADSARQSAFAKKVRPGDHSLIADNGRRADGRHAVRAREYQRAYRALKTGNPEPMRAYKEKYETEP